MESIELKDLVGGAVQEKFNRAFERVVENLQDQNTSFKVKRRITITMDFIQNEQRDDVSCAVNVVEKLAPSSPMATSFAIGKDLKTGEMYAEEYGKQIKGQMKLEDFATPEPAVDAETGEIIENNVVDFRKAAAR